MYFKQISDFHSRRNANDPEIKLHDTGSWDDFQSVHTFTSEDHSTALLNMKLWQTPCALLLGHHIWKAGWSLLKQIDRQHLYAAEFFLNVCWFVLNVCFYITSLVSNYLCQFYLTVTLRQMDFLHCIEYREEGEKNLYNVLWFFFSPFSVCGNFSTLKTQWYFVCLLGWNHTMLRTVYSLKF